MENSRHDYFFSHKFHHAQGSSLNKHLHNKWNIELIFSIAPEHSLHFSYCNKIFNVSALLQIDHDNQPNAVICDLLYRHSALYYAITLTIKSLHYFIFFSWEKKYNRMKRDNLVTITMYSTLLFWYGYACNRNGNIVIHSKNFSKFAWVKC